jgi:hypothetical protein
MFRKVATTIVSITLFITTTVYAQTWTSIRTLWVDALKASAPVEGVLEDELAQLIHQGTGSNQPLKVKAYLKSKDSQKPKCGRVVVEMVQPGVKTTNGETIDYPISYSIEVCEDGTTRPVLCPVTTAPAANAK